MSTARAPRPPTTGRDPSVCLISGEFPPASGGVADYTALLARSLQSLGARVSVLTGPSGGEWSCIADAPPVSRVDGWSPRDLANIHRALAEIQADVVHIQYQAAAYGERSVMNFLPPLLRARGVRSAFITTFHDLRVPYLFPKAGPLRRFSVHTLLGASDGAIFTDPNDLVRAHSRRPSVWIPMGSTVEPQKHLERDDARKALNLASNELVIAHFGFLNASKGVESLLRAAERLQRSGLVFRLLFVGDERGASDSTNAAVADRAHRLARELDLEGHICWTGRLTAEEVSDALRASDMAVLPYTDGASLRRSSLLVCLAHGLPVVTTHPRPAPTLPSVGLVAPFDNAVAYRIDEGVAVLVEPGDDAALAREIYRLAADPGRRDALARGGQALTARLSWPAVAAATLDFYGRVRDGGRP